MLLTKACPLEITALGMMDDPTNPNKVVDFHPLPQVCSSTSTEVADIELSKLSMRLEKAGRDPSMLKCWWHSHAKMKSFFSGTDESQVERYRADGFLWSVVTTHAIADEAMRGKRPDMYIRLDTFGPEGTGAESPLRWTHEGCDYLVEEAWELDEKWAKDLVKELVVEQGAHQQTHATVRTSHQTSRGWAGTGQPYRQQNRSGRGWPDYHARNRDMFDRAYDRHISKTQKGETAPSPDIIAKNLVGAESVKVGLVRAINVFMQASVISAPEGSKMKVLANGGGKGSDKARKDLWASLRKCWYDSKLSSKVTDLLAKELLVSRPTAELYVNSGSTQDLLRQLLIDGRLKYRKGTSPGKVDASGQRSRRTVSQPGLTAAEADDYYFGYGQNWHEEVVPDDAPKGPTTLGEVPLEALSTAELSKKLIASGAATLQEIQAILTSGEHSEVQGRLIALVRADEGPSEEATEAVLTAITEGAQA